MSFTPIPLLCETVRLLCEYDSTYYHQAWRQRQVRAWVWGWASPGFGSLCTRMAVFEIEIWDCRSFKLLVFFVVLDYWTDCTHCSDKWLTDWTHGILLWHIKWLNQFKWINVVYMFSWWWILNRKRLHEIGNSSLSSYPSWSLNFEESLRNEMKSEEVNKEWNCLLVCILLYFNIFKIIIQVIKVLKAQADKLYEIVESWIVKCQPSSLVVNCCHCDTLTVWHSNTDCQSHCLRVRILLNLRDHGPSTPLTPLSLTFCHSQSLL